MSVFCARITAGEVTRLSSRARNLAEAALGDPEGVYTVARTYHRDHVVLFDAHLDRLEDSAKREGISLALDRSKLRRALRSLVDRAGFAETRFRLTIPRDEPEVILVTLEHLPSLPESYRQKGVRAATVLFARSHPKVKSNRLEGLRAQVRRQMPEEVYEGLITGPRAEILEGLSSNFYAFLSGSLRTAEEDILHGISRRIVLEVAHANFPIDRRPVTISDLPGTSEAFMSSSSRGILPVVAVNETTIGNGRPGAKTLQLMSAYGTWVEAHLEPLAPDTAS